MPCQQHIRPALGANRLTGLTMRFLPQRAARAALRLVRQERDVPSGPMPSAASTARARQMPPEMTPFSRGRAQGRLIRRVTRPRRLWAHSRIDRAPGSPVDPCTAQHEAGHAVAYLALGCHLVGVSAVLDSRRAGWCRARRDLTTRFERMVVLWSGPLADLVAQVGAGVVELPEPTSADFGRRLIEWLEQSGAGSDARRLELLARSKDDVARAFLAALALVERWHSVIRLVADALQDAGYLTGREVRWLVRTFGKGNAWFPGPAGWPRRFRPRLRTARRVQRAPAITRGPTNVARQQPRPEVAYFGFIDTERYWRAVQLAFF
jgi:hypothetical protein